MELLEKEFDERARRLESNMNFTEGSNTNMMVDDKEEEDEEDFLGKLSRVSEVVAKKDGEMCTEISKFREVKIHPPVAQRRSSRTLAQGTTIQDQATKLKAKRNEPTGISQFTTFNTQSFNTLSNIANSCKIELGNEKEAHLAIDRLKAQEAANATILQTKRKVEQDQPHKSSANRYACLEEIIIIEESSEDSDEIQGDDSISTNKTKTGLQMKKAPKRGRPKKKK